MLDDEGAITRANNRAVELLEITEEEITNRSYNSSQWELTDENGNTLTQDEYPVRPAFERDELVRNERFGYENPSGEWGLYSLSAAPIHTEDGELERVVITVEDISDA
ncbi:PAS domain-containing protein [Haladaptatus pallidirubidus]|uniref:PAS domain-containing protein n=1 Tax=Haladaptatus pallidirubidus TaxID=1008152 RepID=UPI0035EAA817